MYVASYVHGCLSKNQIIQTVANLMTAWSQFHLTVAKQITITPSKNHVVYKWSYCKSIGIVINQKSWSSHKWGSQVAQQVLW